MQKSAHDTLDERSFRDVMGRYATGVVLLTAQSADGPTGIAANSFASLSLHPPLITFGAARTSTTWPALSSARSFVASILGAGHDDLSRVFATRGIDRFGGHVWLPSPRGHPRVPDALGWIECEIESIHDGGDHELVVARARWWAANDGEPLIFHRGLLGSLLKDRRQ